MADHLLTQVETCLDDNPGDPVAETIRLILTRELEYNHDEEEN